MSDLRVGYPYIVVVERELVSRTVLGWGVCLSKTNFTVLKSADGIRMEVGYPALRDATIARTPADLPEDRHIRNLLQAALMVDMGKHELQLWTQADEPPSTGQRIGINID